jgi:glutamate-1-semialdehyde 2,1-aminomutase
VPDDFIHHTLLLPFNDEEAIVDLLTSRGEEIAAVIVEPVAGNMGCVPPTPGYLQRLRSLTQQQGIVLIFDEVMSGFRAALGGAQQRYAVLPDLTCLGKVVGGGFPVAAVGGTASLMRALAPLGPVYQAGTLAGHPVSMAAGLVTLQELHVEEWTRCEERLDACCQELQAEIQRADLPFKTCLQRAGLMFNLFIGVEKVHSHRDLAEVDQELFRELFAFALDRGVYLPPSAYEAWFISFAHSERDLALLRSVLLEGLTALATPSRRTRK